MNLSKTQLAVVKRTAKSIQPLKNKLERLNIQQLKLQEEVKEINMVIEQFELPIKTMSGGYSIDEILKPIPEVLDPIFETNKGSISSVDETIDIDNINVATGIF